MIKGYCRTVEEAQRYKDKLKQEGFKVEIKGRAATGLPYYLVESKQNENY